MPVKRASLWLILLAVLFVFLSPSPSFSGQSEQEKEKKGPALIATQTATMGQTISIVGKDLTPNIAYQIKWSKEGTIIDCQEELSTDSNGGFTGTVTLPRAIAWHGQGRGNLRAQPKGGRSGLQAFAELTIEKAELTVPKSAQLGQAIEVVGRKFASRTAYLFKWGRGPKIWETAVES